MAPVAPTVLLCLLIPIVAAANFEGQKNFFPYPQFGTPPSVPYTPPVAHGGPAATVPKPPIPGGNPPSGGQGHQSHPIPKPPIPGHGNPPSGGQGHQSHPITPSPRAGGGSPLHTTPTVAPPSPPSPLSPFNPNSPPFSCTYWKNHPALVLGLVGWWGTVHNVFGAASLPGYGPQMNFLQALSNTHTDGFGQLYREGTAALLNAMAHTKFPYSTMLVRDGFMRALGSNKAAAAQARLFKVANEGKA